MGKRGRGGRHKRQRTDEEQKGVRGNYEHAPMQNAKFETFYKESGLIPESEWEQFMETVRRKLPTTFRITGTRSHAKCVQHVLATQYFPKMENLTFEGEEYGSPAPFPWYPEGMAYNCTFSRTLVRKSPELASFHTFLVNEAARGNISRQEAVSMIPPLLLDVQPGQKVLDMCAAPGSKTAQIIERLHADDSDKVPDGMVIANDSDSKRCYLLVHQSKRLDSPCFVVTNDDATRYPNIHQDAAAPSAAPAPMLFDRVLCDVPCSGDGTIRKNPTIWKSWSPYLGPSNHVLQTRILTRGLQQLKVGGLLVYSTCSMHPAENESVVAAALRQYAGKVELVDVSDQLPGLKRTAGVSEWRLQGNNGGQWEWYAAHAEVPEQLRNRLKETMFAQPDCKDMHLDRCVRVFPQQQDTGGFFIALLRKTAPITKLDMHMAGKYDSAGDDLDDTSNVGEEVQEAADEANAKQGEGGLQSSGPGPQQAGTGKKKQQYKKEEPFIFLDSDDIYNNIKEFYGLRDDFPRGQLIVRADSEKARNIYLVSKAVAGLLRNNPSLKIVNTGVRCLSRAEGNHVACEFRLTMESIDLMAPYCTKRKFKLTFQDLVDLLKEEQVDGPRLSHGAQVVMRDWKPGPAILTFDPADPECEGSESMSPTPVTLGCWVGRRNMRLLVNREECFSILLRIAGADVAHTAFDDKLKRKKATEANKAGEGDAPAKRPAEDQSPGETSESGDDKDEDDEVGVDGALEVAE